ncbi:poly(ethylene terephthalate) hydrolase family protein [Herpetosiphon geysericola]|uniref:poly(ethylene terephthalate) hydrolase family protein n=1 Tax=Herpetosiphon geysericola TaxID=70996 RepID=UPI0006C935EA|nr:alpha/beta hydrolase [Herpetosiphon geysericola]
MAGKKKLLWGFLGSFIVLTLLCIIGLKFTAGKRSTYAFDPAYPLEFNYSQHGSLAINHNQVNLNDQQKAIIYYPTDLVRAYPVIIWGNGTIASPEKYAGLFEHLASWGFIVIDSYSENTGDGAAIIQTLDYLIAANADPTNALFQKIQLDQIGAVGTSQGATGIINASNRYPQGQMIKTLITNALPQQRWTDEAHTYDPSLIAVPWLILSGTRDLIVSPAAANQASLEQSSAHKRFLAISVGAGHTEIEDDGGSYRGYLTAWLLGFLADDQQALNIFEPTHGEIWANPHWTHVVRYSVAK